MSFKSKNFTLYLIVILITSCVLWAVEPCVALESTKPGKPIFTIEYPEIIDSSRDGLYLNITNPQFTPYTDDGFEINLYYEAQIRKQGWVDTPWIPVINTRPYIEQSNVQYTIIALPISHNNLDVRVRALVGTVTHNPNNPDAAFTAWYEFKGVEGDWSDIQPVTLNWPTFSPSVLFPSNTSPDNTDSLTPSSLNPNFDDKAVWSIAGVGLLVVVLVVGVVLVIIAVVLSVIP
jgi:hypothetical protein